MGTFEISRGLAMAADPALVHTLVNDLRTWPGWSPWEGLDDDVLRTYSGPERGVGAHYAWVGGRRTGQGSMEIVDSTPERIALTLTFVRPWKATNDVVFDFVAARGGAEVTWRMSGEQRGLAALRGRFVLMDRRVGRDFEKGLGRLRGLAEAEA
jgi:hypothetical protein